MNIDRDLVARAFTKAGEEPITDAEWSDAESSRVRVVKEFYLATLLEALSSYDWTSQKNAHGLHRMIRKMQTMKKQKRILQATHICTRFQWIALRLSQ